LLQTSEFQVFTRFSKVIGERQPTCQLVAGRRSSVGSLRNPKEFVQRKERELSWPGDSLDCPQFSGKSENRLSRPGLFAFRTRLARGVRNDQGEQGKQGSRFRAAIPFLP